MTDLKAIELRLNAILDPYRDRLEAATIYNMPILRKAGAKAHDWFAGVQGTEGAVKFNLLPMHAHPTLLGGVSPALRKRKTGASVLKFTEMDEPLFKELESLVARAFETYMAGEHIDRTRLRTKR
jgi:hypothetical protein